MSIDPNGRRRAERAGSGLRLLATLTLLIVSTSAAQAHEVSPSRSDFVPPAPGSYRLERIQQLPDGAVLDSRNRRARLAEFAQGRITLLSLMYTSCSDP